MGPHLGRFGVVLVPILGSKIIKIHWILQVFVKIDVFEHDKVWVSILGRFGIDFGSQMELKWDPKWSENGIKHRSKK